ncbi:MAG: integrase core domain-containing protein, partial [Pirellula sp.]
MAQEGAGRVVKQFVSDYNDRRLHSAIGYITPS